MCANRRIGTLVLPTLERQAAGEEARVDNVGGTFRLVEASCSTLDTSRLDELDALGERATALVDRAISNFVSGLSTTLVELESAVERDDAVAVTATAHRLRGSALNLGADRVAEVTLALELLGDSGNLTGCRERLVDLRRAGDDAVAALRHYQSLKRPGIAPERRSG